MSRCPLVTGSKEPGQTTRRNRVHSPVGDIAAGWCTCGETVPERCLAVSAGSVRFVPYRPGRRPGPGRPLQRDQRAGREPALAQQRGQDLGRARRRRPRTADRRTRNRAARPSQARARSTPLDPVGDQPRARQPDERRCSAGSPARPGRRPRPAARRRRRGTAPPARRRPSPRTGRARPRRAGRRGSLPRSRTGPPWSGRWSAWWCGPARSPAAGRPPARDDPGHDLAAAGLVTPFPGTWSFQRRPAPERPRRGPGAPASAGSASTRAVASSRAWPIRSSSSSSRSSSQAGLAASLRGAEHVALPALRPGRSGTARTRPACWPPRPAAPWPARPPAPRSPAGTGPGRLPRPTRPRSWCSWETPNRSASMITITTAFGTSTPTSTTVVVTSTSTRPSAKASITLSFSSGGSLPCRIARRRPASGPAASSAARSRTATGGRGRRLAAIVAGRPRSRPRHRRPVAADPRADHVGLAARADLLPDPLPGPGQVVRPLGDRHDVRRDRRAPGRQLGQGRHVQVAEDRHGHGPRDRRRGHHEHVRPAVPGLVPQRVPLLDAEPVLLVDDDQAEVGELHPVLEQRVGADDDAGLARGGLQQRLAPGRPRPASRSAGSAWSRARRRRAGPAMPSGPSRLEIDRKCCCASTSVGASRTACPAASTTCSIARSAMTSCRSRPRPAAAGASDDRAPGRRRWSRRPAAGRRSARTAGVASKAASRPPSDRRPRDGAVAGGGQPALRQQHLQGERLVPLQPASWTGARRPRRRAGGCRAARRRSRAGRAGRAEPAGSGSSGDVQHVQRDPHRVGDLPGRHLGAGPVDRDQLGGELGGPGPGAARPRAARTPDGSAAACPGSWTPGRRTGPRTPGLSSLLAPVLPAAAEEGQRQPAVPVGHDRLEDRSPGRLRIRRTDDRGHLGLHGDVLAVAQADQVGQLAALVVPARVVAAAGRRRCAGQAPRPAAWPPCRPMTSRSGSARTAMPAAPSGSPRSGLPPSPWPG